MDYVYESGGIDYAQKIMLQYRKEALEILHTFKEGEARTALEGLVNYTIERKK